MAHQYYHRIKFPTTIVPSYYLWSTFFIYLYKLVTYRYITIALQHKKRNNHLLNYTNINYRLIYPFMLLPSTLFRSVTSLIIPVTNTTQRRCCEYSVFDHSRNGVVIVNNFVFCVNALSLLIYLRISINKMLLALYYQLYFYCIVI